MSDINGICERIVTRQRIRCFAIKSQQQIDRSTDAFYVQLKPTLLSKEAGTSSKWTDKDKKALKGKFAEAKNFRVAVEKGQTADIAQTMENLLLMNIIEASALARQHWDFQRQMAEDELRNLAQELPVWKGWAKTVKGFAPLGLAIIVGEAGNLSNYPGCRLVYKRLGLGVFDGGIRQGGLPSGATAAEWIEHGYNKKRRAQIWAMIDDVMLRNQARGVNKGAEIGPYAKVYYERKQFEIENREDRTDGHVDRRARRYMTKVFIRDLWRAWKICDDAVIEEQQYTLAAD